MKAIIQGWVIKGDGYGKKLGYPTANLDRRQFMRLARKPRFGIYAGTATIGSISPAPRLKLGASSPFKDRVKIWKAGIVIGPLDKTRKPKVEAHLLGFKGNLYGQRLQLTLIKYLRPFMMYKNELGLKAQIKNDINKVKKLIK